MRKKSTVILSLAAIGLACIGLASCSEPSELDKLKEKGYTVFVTYDANGGRFLQNDNIKQIIDAFNPSTYEKDSNGDVHIQLKEPRSEDRPTSGSKITLGYTDHFFAGWYQNRTVVEVNGVPVDEYGVALTLQEDGSYVYASTVNDETPKIGVPAYNYSGYWDFETDTVDVAYNGSKEITLYAGWVRLYEFQYYYHQEDDPKTENVDETGWTQYGATSFNYATTNEVGSTTADKDTIWLPDWLDGAMNHTYEYANKEKYEFPKKDGSTFVKAYLDEERTQEITTKSFEHTGTLNACYGEEKKLVFENRVQKIYVDFEAGEKYKISTADQLLKTSNVNLNGNYEILADLDFTGKNWPMKFAQNEFKGTFASTAGQNFVLSNVNVKYNSSSATYGGLFGAIGDGATVKDVTFSNATLDITSATLQNNSYFGLFAGLIDDGATVENVTVGGRMKLGTINCRSGLTKTFNLVATGNVQGITAQAIALTVYPKVLMNKYHYYVKPTDITVDENKQLNLLFQPMVEYPEAEYNYQF